MNYEEALEELEEAGYFCQKGLTERQVEAIEASKRALRDCLEMGLNGEP